MIIMTQRVSTKNANDSQFTYSHTTIESYSDAFYNSMLEISAVRKHEKGNGVRIVQIRGGYIRYYTYMNTRYKVECTFENVVEEIENHELYNDVKSLDTTILQFATRNSDKELIYQLDTIRAFKTNEHREYVMLKDVNHHVRMIHVCDLKNAIKDHMTKQMNDILFAEECEIQSNNVYDHDMNVEQLRNELIKVIDDFDSKSFMYDGLKNNKAVSIAQGDLTIHIPTNENAQNCIVESEHYNHYYTCYEVYELLVKNDILGAP